MHVVRELRFVRRERRFNVDRGGHESVADAAGRAPAGDLGGEAVPEAGILCNGESVFQNTKMYKSVHKSTTVLVLNHSREIIPASEDVSVECR